MNGATGGDGRGRGTALVVGSLVVSLVLVGAYLAAGGATYEPEKVQNPCKHRPWSNPHSLGGIANQFTTSALDGAACKLGVSRETLARALATPQSRRRFAEKYGITDRKLAEAIRAGLLRAVNDAEEAGALSPLLAAPLRDAFRNIPLEEAIELLKNARSLLSNIEGFLGPAGSIIERFLP